MPSNSGQHSNDFEVDSSDKGFALVSVIWIAGLLAVLATAFTISMRSHILAGRNIVQGERAQYIADGMAQFTALKLAVNTASGASETANGTSSICTWSDSARVSVAIQDQGGLVDVNTAAPALLDVLFQRLGFADRGAAEMIAGLRDFRDPDSEAEDGGSEPALYPGKEFGPKNAPFSGREELDQLPGMSDAMFDQLLRLTTVYSQQPGIDWVAAPQSLKDLLGIADKSSPQAMIYASPSPFRVYAIDVAVELKEGSRYVRHAIISLLRQPDRPFAILAWQRGKWPSDINLSTATDAKPCLN